MASDATRTRGFPSFGADGRKIVPYSQFKPIKCLQFQRVNLYKVLTIVCSTQNYSISRLCSSSIILNNPETRHFRNRIYLHRERHV
jgi:hypothetical protein